MTRLTRVIDDDRTTRTTPRISATVGLAAARRSRHSGTAARFVRTAAVAVVAATVLAGALAGCRAATPTSVAAAGSNDVLAAVSTDKPTDGVRTARIPRSVSVTSDLVYGTAADGTVLRLDVCSPARVPGAAALPGVVAIHGGSWSMGDKANTDWRAVCRWLASAGFVAYSLDYRLVPAVTFPAAIDDVNTAVAWIRRPANAARFGIDPARLGVLGGSAGANLAALLGMRGSGPTDTGTRVAAVAELSGPIDLTEAGQRLGHPVPYVAQIERAYLGCRTFSDCPQAMDASPLYAIDRSDPPVFIAQSSDELIPREQGDAFAAALSRAHVPHTLVTMPGKRHSVALLDPPMRRNIVAFLHRYLG
ncbi:alpha/beta hydrolase [Leifsonia sp. Root112D2]|uniref:alpha/beta hydrolase n=1 Tax=Leifsonia sp. Root112D2 TaxID=1736426 RepID=UPI000ACCCFC7|nr:alpha/beta hydrolase [Leifsonia sp. Root112D2]